MKVVELPKEIYAASGYVDDDLVNYWDTNIEYISDPYAKYVRSDLVPKWHKYPDEKPRYIGDYIVTIKKRFPFQTHNEVLFASYNNVHRFRSYDDDGNVNFDNNVIAWQEIPEPYKEN